MQEDDLMAIDYAFEPREGFLYVTATGVFGRAEAIRSFPRILDACLAHNRCRVLVDFRQMRTPHPFPAMDVYEYGTAVARSVVEYRDKGLAGFRLVFFGMETQVDPNRFGETVIQNRGANVKSMTDLDEALAWLLQDEADSY